MFIVILVTTQQSSAAYDLQTEIYDKMVSYNTTNVSPLCHNWKAWICFDLWILRLTPFFCSANYFIFLAGSEF